MQLKFQETLKYRIDSRVIKHLKQKKHMKLDELVEQVLFDLQMQLNMPQNQEQVANNKEMILKRIDDLQERVYLKKDNEMVEYVPV